MTTYTVIRLPAVISLTGLSRSTIYNRIAQTNFPKPVSLGGNSVGWIEEEVQSWLKSQIELPRKEYACPKGKAE